MDSNWSHQGRSRSIHSCAGNFALEEGRRIVSDFRIYIIEALGASVSHGEVSLLRMRIYGRQCGPLRPEAIQRGIGDVSNLVGSRFPAKFAPRNFTLRRISQSTPFYMYLQSNPRAGTLISSRNFRKCLMIWVELLLGDTQRDRLSFV